MEPVTPTASAGIAKVIASVLALASPSERLVETPLSLQLETPAEVLVMLNPVDFEIWERENGGADVVVQLSAEDRARFSDFTARHIGDVVGFSVCGEVIVAPRIVERIDVGGLMLSGSDNLLGFIQNGCP